MQIYTSNWRKENKDKLREYRKNQKEHDITEEELKFLYEYANNSCMYCGISEIESIEKYGQKLHKDHAINNGSGGIENCILSCRICNSSKNIKDWEEWYIPNNPIYSVVRYEIIKEWLNSFK